MYANGDPGGGPYNQRLGKSGFGNDHELNVIDGLANLDFTSIDDDERDTFYSDESVSKKPEPLEMYRSLQVIAFLYPNSSKFIQLSLFRTNLSLMKHSRIIPMFWE